MNFVYDKFFKNIKIESKKTIIYLSLPKSFKIRTYTHTNELNQKYTIINIFNGLVITFWWNL